MINKPLTRIKQNNETIDITGQTVSCTISNSHIRKTMEIVL